MERARLILKPREEARIRAGHPWVYDNEIAGVEGQPDPGSEVEIFDSSRRSLGTAFFNPKSKIRARIYSRLPRQADESLFAELLEEALAYRRRHFDPERHSLRLAFGEADGLPGLIVDSFVGIEPKGRWLSAQFLSLGVDARKKDILGALAAVFPSDGVAERSDAPVRALEGLPIATGILAGEVPQSAIIEENGLRFAVDILGGQKTGWFLDQRSNRAAAARYAKGRRVLDAFCNAGGFGIACAASGAASVMGIDSSHEATSAFQANATLNGFASLVETREANAFDILHELERTREKFGLIIIDPPAFAKNRAAIEGARRGYKELNLRGLKLLERGGILVSCSCSHWFGPELFGAMLADAAADSGRRVRILEERTQDLDHPIVTGYGESRYLKCVIAEAT